MDPEITLVRISAPIREQVTDAIRNQIMSGRLAPGERLIERELCEMTGASRPSVREALRQLETEGMVTGVPQKGMVVAHVSLADALSIYEVRAVLEGLIAGAFARRANNEQRSRLFRKVADLSDTADKYEIIRVKTEIYEILFEGADNPVAEQFLGSLQARVSVMRTKSVNAPGRPAATVREVEHLVAAIRDRDVDAATAAAQFHVRQAARALEQVLLAESADSPTPSS